MPDALIRVRVQPGAKRDELAGRREGRVVVRVTARPAEGKANEAVCRLLAKLTGIPRNRVEVVRGASAREKTVRIAGLDPGEVIARLGYS